MLASWVTANAVQTIQLVSIPVIMQAVMTAFNGALSGTAPPEFQVH